MSLQQLPRDLIPHLLQTLTARDCLNFGLTSKRHLAAFIQVIARRPGQSDQAVEYYCHHGYLQSLKYFLAGAPSYIPSDRASILSIRRSYTMIARIVIGLNAPVFTSNCMPWCIADRGCYKIFKLIQENSPSANIEICKDTEYFSEIIARAAYRGSLKIVRAVLSQPYTHIGRIDHVFIMLMNGGDRAKIAEELLTDPVVYCDIDVSWAAKVAIHFHRGRVLLVLIRHVRMNLKIWSELMEYVTELGRGYEEIVRLLEKSRREIKKYSR